MTDPYKLPVHPAADLYPMLFGDDIEALARSIKDVGQIHPVIIATVDGDPQEYLVDGRNRLAACELAGVKPQVHAEQFSTEHALRTWVLALNNERRHMTKSQRVMAHALVFPEAMDAIESGRRGGSGSKTEPLASGSKSEPLPKSRLAEARSILRFCGEAKGREVLSGACTFNAALSEVKEERARLERKDNSSNQARSRIEAIAEAYPEVAQSVIDEEQTLLEAEQEVREREEARTTALVLRAENMGALDKAAMLTADNVTELLTSERPYFDKHAPAAVADKAYILEMLRHLADELPGIINALEEYL